MKNVETNNSIAPGVECSTLAELAILTDEQVSEVSGGVSIAQFAATVGGCPCMSGADILVVNSFQAIINPVAPELDRSFTGFGG